MTDKKTVTFDDYYAHISAPVVEENISKKK